MDDKIIDIKEIAADKKKPYRRIFYVVVDPSTKIREVLSARQIPIIGQIHPQDDSLAAKEIQVTPFSRRNITSTDCYFEVIVDYARKEMKLK